MFSYSRSISLRFLLMVSLLIVRIERCNSYRFLMFLRRVLQSSSRALISAVSSAKYMIIIIFDHLRLIWGVLPPFPTICVCPEEGFLLEFWPEKLDYLWNYWRLYCSYSSLKHEITQNKRPFQGCQGLTGPPDLQLGSLQLWIKCHVEPSGNIRSDSWARFFQGTLPFPQNIIPNEKTGFHLKETKPKTPPTPDEDRRKTRLSVVDHFTECSKRSRIKPGNPLSLEDSQTSFKKNAINPSNKLLMKAIF